MKTMKKVLIPILTAILVLSVWIAQPRAVEAAATIEEGVYYLYSGVGNRVLDIAGGSKSNGANAQLYVPNNSKDQQFRVQKSGKKRGTKRSPPRPNTSRSGMPGASRS